MRFDPLSRAIQVDNYLVKERRPFKHLLVVKEKSGQECRYYDDRQALIGMKLWKRQVTLFFSYARLKLALGLVTN